MTKLNDPALRAQVIRNLELLLERYPNLRLGQIIDNAISGRTSLFFIGDDEFALALNQLFITYTQFESAGIMEKKR